MELLNLLGLPELPKLGKLKAKHDLRTLMFQDYYKLPDSPPERAWSKPVKDWGMMLNDKVGNCTIAGGAHLIQSWTANQGKEIIISDADVLSIYSQLSGYDSKTGNNDTGLNELDVLNYWRNTGIAGHKITAFMKVNRVMQDHVKAAINLFGGLYIGVGLPLSVQDKSYWDSTGTTGDDAPWSWGGHCVCVLDYDSDSLTCITWGTTLKMSWDFFETYSDESYAIISDDFLSNGKTPNGFDLAALQEDLRCI